MKQYNGVKVIYVILLCKFSDCFLMNVRDDYTFSNKGPHASRDLLNFWKLMGFLFLVL